MIDASYTMHDGGTFGNVAEFRSLVVAKPRELARNVAEKLIRSGPGARFRLPIDGGRGDRRAGRGRRFWFSVARARSRRQ